MLPTSGREMGDRVGGGSGGRVRVVRAMGTGGLHDDGFVFKNFFFGKYKAQKYAKFRRSKND